MSQIKFSSGPGPGLLSGIVFMLMGCAVLAIAFGVIPTDPAEIHVPGWVLVVFGGLFVSMGIWVIFLRSIRPGSAQAGWINFLFALLVMTFISLLCLWIGFGAGQRVFLHYETYSVRNPAMLTNPTLGRIFFGSFGVLLSASTLILAVLGGRRLLAGDSG